MKKHKGKKKDKGATSLFEPDVAGANGATVEYTPLIDARTASLRELRDLAGKWTPAEVLSIITRLEDVTAQRDALERSRVGYRSEDEPTSVGAADDARKREGNLTTFGKNTHRHRLLVTYVRPWQLDERHGGLADNEAADIAGLNKPGTCYWKRCSELRQAGFTELTGAVHVDPDSGKEREVCRITDTGRKYLEHLGPVRQNSVS